MDFSNSVSDPLLEPFKLKNLILRNRVMSTSHACGLGDFNHMPGETYQRYHLEKAKGGLALTMFGGSSYIAEDSLWSSNQLNVSVDSVIPYLQQFSDRIHAEGAAIMIQMTHLGRRAETYTQNWLPTLAPSVLRETGHRSIPREIDRHDINRIVKAFGDAAVRAEKGGLDGLETMSHGHLIGQFLSPFTNRRTDAFGGSLENRCRFALMVHEEIRNRVGADFIIGIRMSIDESEGGGSTFEESLEIASVFEREGLFDFFNLSFGRIDTELALANECMPGMAMPGAPWLDRVASFKKEVGLPVFHAAKISDIATARYAIREGLLDMVAMTRAHIADPQIVNKIKRGEEDRIRPCVGTSHCMGDRRPTCIHNPAAGRERFWPQTLEKTPGPIHKVVVVGGGPAGLEAARVCAERGHKVKLFEAADALGGQLRLAERSDWKRDLNGIVEWRKQELERLNVDVCLNSYAEAEDVMSESPSIVIIATGGIPNLEGFEGSEHCISSWDAISGNASLGTRVIIYDGTGRQAAPMVAERSKHAGKTVHYVMLDEVLAKELVYAERVIWRKRFAEEGILPHAELSLVSVERSGNNLLGIFAHELTGEILRFEGDSVVIEYGTVPITDLYDGLQDLSSNKGVMETSALIQGFPQPGLKDEGFALFRIGDALSSRDIPSAMFDALRLCHCL